MGQISPHFRQEEFDCRGMGRDHPVHPCPVDGVLLQKLERLRTICGGRPLTIVSGYRCLFSNRRVGGAPKSMHLGHPATTYGPSWAADIPQGYATVAQAEQAGFVGIGNKGPWAVHVDVRHTRARWSY